jgi:hypothetical protein
VGILPQTVHAGQIHLYYFAELKAQSRRFPENLHAACEEWLGGVDCDAQAVAGDVLAEGQTPVAKLLPVVWCLYSSHPSYCDDA